VRNLSHLSFLVDQIEKMQKPNRISSQARVRRYVYYLGILTILLFIFAQAHKYYSKDYLDTFDQLEPTVPYNEYIDVKGQYLPYPGYKILQMVLAPISSDFSALRNYLNEQIDLISYFKLVPSGAHHITLNNLKNQTALTPNQLSILKTEQELIDRDQTMMSCLGKKLTMIDKREIRLEIEITDQNFNDLFKKYQQRWNTKFPELIVERPTSFYLTLAYQYRTIPHPDIYDELIKILKLWETYPIEIYLGPIEIAFYTTVISYTPVLSDIIYD
jgi:hypothetical protein